MRVTCWVKEVKNAQYTFYSIAEQTGLKFPVEQVALKFRPILIKLIQIIFDQNTVSLKVQVDLQKEQDRRWAMLYNEAAVAYSFFGIAQQTKLYLPEAACLLL